jgi:S1-C subfamily serine protease
LAIGALALGIGLGRATNSGSSSSNSSQAAFQQPSFNPGGNSNSGSSGSSGSSNGNGFGGLGNGSSNGSSNASGGTSGDSLGVTSKVAPAIVNIDTVVGDQGEAAGTGMIVTSSGEVVTNNHVIDGATQISVELADGSTHSAKVLGYDATDDVALIKINGVSGLPTISTASASSVSIGDQIVALGNALGKGGTPTAASGQVTDLNQTITASDDNGANAETLHGLIQTNAPIQPGDSGGALINSDAKVIGMNAAASVSGGSGFGFRQTSATEGFAIPIDNALAIAQQIDAGKGSDKIHIGDRGILGVLVTPDQSSSSGGGFGNFGGNSGNSSGNGAAVSSVTSGSPADNAGLASGDTIVSVNGSSVGSADALQSAMANFHPGDKVSIGWVDSNGSRHNATITLIAGPPA